MDEAEAFCGGPALLLVTGHAVDGRSCKPLPMMGEGLPAMLLSDLELRACAQQVMKQHGGKALLHVASCIDELATAGGR